jgi:hypothetical protein
MSFRTDDVYDMNRDYRAEMMRQAANERLVRAVRHDDSRRVLHHVVMAWAGRRLVATGSHLLEAADSARPHDISLVTAKRA